MNNRTNTSEVTPDADELLFDLMERLTQKVQSGEAVDIETYVQKYPQHTKRLRKMSSTLQALANLAEPTVDTQSHHAGRSGDEMSVAGSTLGDYQVIREIGRGGMGVVYEAKQLSLDRQVALKVLPFAAVLDKRQLKRFHFEAQAAAQLHHTNIVPVFAVGCERGVHYYAMQYIEGQTLADVIHNMRQFEGPGNLAGKDKSDGQLADGQLPNQIPRPIGRTGRGSPADVDSVEPIPGPSVKDTVRYARAAISTERSAKSATYFRNVSQLGIQVAEGLGHAHHQGVVHRDIKPSNLILDAGGTVWITDFGLARIETDAGLTMTGDIVGTLRYMSPEQALAKRVVVDHRTDVYSLGVTLFEMLTLQPAYAGKHRAELLRQIAFEEPRPPRRLNRAIPVELETIVLKAMAKNPAERYETAQELANDLQRFLEDKPIHARRPTLPQRMTKWSRRHKPLIWSMAAASAIVLVVTAVGGVVAGGMIAQRQKQIALQQQEIAEKNRQIAAKSQDIAAQERADRITAETLLSASYIDFGQALAELGEIGRGMLWMARSLEIAPEGATEVQQTARANLAAWHRHLHVLRTRVNYPGKIRAVDFSSDGSRILASGEDMMVRMWDSDTGRPVGKPLEHESIVRGMSVSPKGSHIATVCDDGTMKIWDTAASEPTDKSPDHEGRITIVCYNHDGSRLLTVGNDGSWKIQEWDVSDLRPIGKPLRRGQPVLIESTPVGMRAVIRIEDQGFQLWDVDRGEPVGPPAKKAWRPGAISSDGSRFVGRRFGGMLLFWDGKTGELGTPQIRQAGTIHSMDFSPDGSRIVSGGNVRAAVIWDVATGKPVGAPLKQHASVDRVRFARDGRRVLVASTDGTMRLWDVAPGSTSSRAIEHADPILAVAFSPDGLRILSDHDGMGQLRDAAGEPIGKPFRHYRQTGRMIYSPDGSLVLTKTWGGRICDASTGEPVGKPLPRTTYGVAFSPDSSRALFGTQFSGAELWDIRAGELVGRLPKHQQPTSAVAFSPDGTRIVTGSYDATTQLWDAESLEPIGDALAHQSMVQALAYSPDGTRIAVGFADGTARLFDPNTREPVSGQLHHRELVSAVTFSPDGSQLLTCSMDQTARLWEVATLKPIGPPLRHNNNWPGGSFSRDGAQLLITGVGVPRVWRAPPGAVAGAVEQVVIWTQVVTGMELDASGGIEVLDGPTWRKRHEQLADMKNGR